MMQVVFNGVFSVEVDQASESYINHVRQFWCRNDHAENINIDTLRADYLEYIPSEQVTSIALYNDEDVLLFELEGIYKNLEINKFYLEDGTCFFTLTLRKELQNIVNTRGIIPEESDA